MLCLSTGSHLRAFFLNSAENFFLIEFIFLKKKHFLFKHKRYQRNKMWGKKESISVQTKKNTICVINFSQKSSASLKNISLPN